MKLEESRKIYADRLLKRIAHHQYSLQRAKDKLDALPFDTDYLQHLVGRYRDRQFVRAFVENVSLGQDPNEAGAAAVATVWPRMTQKGTQIARARAKLAQPNICQAIETIFEAVADFTLKDAVEFHVKHIKGEIVKHVVDGKTGKVIEVPGTPSYPALKDYFAHVLPRQALRVQGEHVHLVEDGKIIREEIAAQEKDVTPRYVGPVIESSGSDEHELDEEELRELAGEEPDDDDPEE